MRRPTPPPHRSTWLPLVQRAIEEDLGAGDVTSAITVAADTRGVARIEARQALVVCGLDIAREVFCQIDPALGFEIHAADGDAVGPGDRLVTATGNVRRLLEAERPALNFLARLCGVATLTRSFVDATKGTRAQIVDTRKTLPGWRLLDKYAVAVGGGVNHRVGLYDGILLKDNHIAAAGGVEAAVKTALAAAPAGLRVQVEVQSAEEAQLACEAGADFLLLDNLPPAEIAPIVERWADHAILEASGGVNLDNVRRYAETGIHRISIGALTHSAPGVDLAMEMDSVDAGG